MPLYLDTKNISGMIFMILIGAGIFNAFIESTGLTDALIRVVEQMQLSRWWVMAAALLLTVITGLDYVYRALTLRQTSARAMRAAATRRAAGPSGAGGARTDTAA